MYVNYLICCITVVYHITEPAVCLRYLLCLCHTTFHKGTYLKYNWAKNKYNACFCCRSCFKLYQLGLRLFTDNTFSFCVSDLFMQMYSCWMY